MSYNEVVYDQRVLHLRIEERHVLYIVQRILVLFDFGFNVAIWVVRVCLTFWFSSDSFSIDQVQLIWIT